jgi:hypothetical protein
MAIFEIYGPFILARKENGMLDLAKGSKKRFWTEVSRKKTGLENSRGCYLFACQAGKGITPWYVGKTERQSFKNEIFQPHKIQIYQDVLADKKYTPMFFLISRITKKSKFSKPKKKGDSTIAFLEILLIGAALDKNRRILNLKNTSKLKKIVVPGFLNSPKRKLSNQERDFRRAIF